MCKLMKAQTYLNIMPLSSNVQLPVGAFCQWPHGVLADCISTHRNEYMTDNLTGSPSAVGKQTHKLTEAYKSGVCKKS